MTSGTDTDREAAAAADAFVEHIGELRPVMPPLDVCRKIVADARDPADAVSRYVAPHWEAARRFFDKQGYVALVTLVDRLRAHRDEARADVERAEKRVGALGLLRDAVRSEARKHGPGTTLLDSLGAGSSTGGRWHWEPVASGAVLRAFSFSTSGSSDLIYSGLKIDRRTATFDAGATWAEAEADAEAEHAAAVGPNSDLERWKRLWATVDFRYRVSKRVLEEFELLGHVAEHGGRGWYQEEIERIRDAARLVGEEYYVVVRLADVLHEEGGTVKGALSSLRSIVADDRPGARLAVDTDRNGNSRDEEQQVRRLENLLKTISDNYGVQGLNIGRLKDEGRRALPAAILPKP